MIARKRLVTSLLLLACALAAAPACNVRFGRRGDDRAALERHFRAGNDALTARRFDDAVRHYDAGLALSPGHPSFLTNKAAAFRQRGVTHFNAALRLGDESARAAEKGKAGEDFRAAEALATEAVRQVQRHGLGVFQPLNYEETKVAAYNERAEALRILASRFDKPRAPEAMAAIREYIEVEPDAAERVQARLRAGQMLLDAGRGDEAAAVYREVLAGDAEHLDALLGVGLALAQSGDAAKYREAAVYLRRFVARAPDDHPLKASARETLEFVNRPAPSVRGLVYGAAREP